MKSLSKCFTMTRNWYVEQIATSKYLSTLISVNNPIGCTNIEMLSVLKHKVPTSRQVQRVHVQVHRSNVVHPDHTTFDPKKCPLLFCAPQVYTTLILKIFWKIFFQYILRLLRGIQIKLKILSIGHFHGKRACICQGFGIYFA